MTPKTEQREALASLRDDYKLTPGETVYTVLRHVSRSGMYRAIDLYVMRERNGVCEPRRITYTASQLLEGYDRRHEAARASGCGMDMGFHLVYELSSILFRDGFDCIGTTEPSGYVSGCPSNDHMNRHMYEERGEEVPTHHKDGGYALTHRWM